MSYNSYTDDKLIYQYGNAIEPNYIFFKGKFQKNIATSVKTMYSDSFYIDGQVDMLQKTKARKNSYELECTFYNSFNSPYSLDYINRVFYGEPRLSFYYDYAYDPTAGKNQREFGKIYYNYTRCIKPPNQSESQRDNMEKNDLVSDVILKPNTPYFYDCSDDVEYVLYTDYTAAVRQWDNNSLQWDNVSNLGWDYATNQFAVVSGLSNANKLDYFTNKKPDDPKYILFLKDRFFNRDTKQTNRNYVINETQNANTSSDYVTNDILQNASADTDIYRIELNQMAPNQTVEIKNLTNNSGIKITWLESSPSNAVLVYNSYYKKLYETTSETEIDSSKYSIQIPTENARALYFRGLVNPFRIRELPYEQIRITNQGVNNLTVKIDVLPAYD